MPAGLLTATRCASQYKISSGTDASAVTAAVGLASTSTAITWPAPSRSPFFADLAECPSRLTRPSRIRRRAAWTLPPISRATN